MEESGGKEKNCIVKIDYDLQALIDASSGSCQWENRSIYNLPSCITDLNPKAYEPQAVSFGPYHNGKNHLVPMEEHKHRALAHFLKRTEESPQELLKSLSEEIEKLRNSYHPLNSKWRDDDKSFLKMMLLDGCFVLEILLRNGGDEEGAQYDENDPIFSKHGTSTTMSSTETYLHILDLVRKIHIKNANPKNGGGGGGDEKIIRSATELNEAGIIFKKSITTSFRDVSFTTVRCSGVLSLPVIIVDDATESKLLNMLAFERLHVGAGNEVTSYVFLMDNIIENERDVALLHDSGIIQNAMGSAKAAADLFNSLSKDTTLDPSSSLSGVHGDVHRFCKKRMNRYRASLWRNYFTSPWAIISLVAAILLFVLTMVQTYYTIYPYYNPREPPNEASPRSRPRH